MDEKNNVHTKTTITPDTSKTRLQNPFVQYSTRLYSPYVLLDRVVRLAGDFAGVETFFAGLEQQS